MTLEIMRKLIERLEEAALYELIFVLLTVHRDAPLMKHFSDYLLVGTLADNWETEQKNFMRNLMAHFA